MPIFIICKWIVQKHKVSSNYDQALIIVFRVNLFTSPQVQICIFWEFGCDPAILHSRFQICLLASKQSMLIGHFTRRKDVGGGSKPLCCAWNSPHNTGLCAFIIALIKLVVYRNSWVFSDKKLASSFAGMFQFEGGGIKNKRGQTFLINKKLWNFSACLMDYSYANLVADSPSFDFLMAWASEKLIHPMAVAPFQPPPMNTSCKNLGEQRCPNFVAFLRVFSTQKFDRGLSEAESRILLHS